MTQDEMTLAVQSLKFGHPFSGLDFRVELTHDDGACAYFFASAALAERDTGDRRRARSTKKLEYKGMDRPSLLRALRDLLGQFLVHELDESILVDGLRVFDPHGPGAIPTGFAALGGEVNQVAKAEAERNAALQAATEAVDGPGGWRDVLAVETHLKEEARRQAQANTEEAAKYRAAVERAKDADGMVDATCLHPYHLSERDRVDYRETVTRCARHLLGLTRDTPPSGEGGES